MEERNYMQNEKSITISDIFILLKKYWLQVVSIIVVCTILLGVAAFVLAKPKYSAKATIMVNYVAENDSVSNNNTALGMSLKLINTISDFAVSDIVQRDVKSVIKGHETNVEANYRGGLSIATDPDSLIITISYTTKTSPAAAVETVNQVVDSLINVANSVDNTGRKEFPTIYDTIKVVDDATRWSKSETWPTFVILGFVLGVVLAIAFIVIKFLLDDTIKSRGELERLTGYNVIAFIEDIEVGKKG